MFLSKKDKREKSHLVKIGAEVGKDVRLNDPYHLPFAKFVNNHLFTLGLLKEGVDCKKSVSLYAFTGRYIAKWRKKYVILQLMFLILF